MIRKIVKEHLTCYIYRHHEVTLTELAAKLRQTEETIQAMVDRLILEGKLLADRHTDKKGVEEIRYKSTTCSVPVGDKQGWEAAVYDHFQAMAKAVANKLNQYGACSDYSDHIGGATLSFDLYSGHPQEAEVLSLLNRYRDEINLLWQKVVTTNQQVDHPQEPQNGNPFKVTFYMGQNVEQRESDLE